MKEKVISHQLNVSLKECMFESNKSTLGLCIQRWLKAGGPGNGRGECDTWKICCRNKEGSWAVA